MNIKLQTFSFIINTKVNKTKAWNKMKNKRYQTVGTNRKIVETVYRGRHPFTENLRYMTAHFYGLVYVQFLCSSIPEFHKMEAHKNQNSLTIYVTILLVIVTSTVWNNHTSYFNFPIVNFLFLCSNIPAAPAYRVYNS